jgi:hypothetical protein
VVSRVVISSLVIDFSTGLAMNALLKFKIIVASHSPDILIPLVHDPTSMMQIFAVSSFVDSSSAPTMNTSSKVDTRSVIRITLLDSVQSCNITSVMEPEKEHVTCFHRGAVIPFGAVVL